MFTPNNGFHIFHEYSIKLLKKTTMAKIEGQLLDINADEILKKKQKTKKKKPCRHRT